MEVPAGLAGSEEGSLGGNIVAYSWGGGNRVTSPSDRAFSLSREYGAQGGTPQFDLSASRPRVPHYIMDDVPSKYITFPKILLIQETIVKIGLNH